MIRYYFRPDEVLTIKKRKGADPQELGEVLAEIQKKTKGRLSPADVLDEARDRKSPLHKHFEWEDAVAAEAYRLDQARTLVRAIHVKNEEADGGYARAFISINDKGGTAYRALDEVLNSADLQSRWMAQAEKDFLSLERKYQSVMDICVLIREARERLVALRQRRKNEGDEPRAAT